MQSLDHLKKHQWIGSIAGSVTLISFCLLIYALTKWDNKVEFRKIMTIIGALGVLGVILSFTWHKLNPSSDLQQKGLKDNYVGLAANLTLMAMFAYAWKNHQKGKVADIVAWSAMYSSMIIQFVGSMIVHGNDV